MNKEEIRIEMRKKLYSQSREEIKVKSQKIMAKLVNVKQFKKAKTVGTYIAKPYEVDTNFTLRHMLEEKEFSVPVMNGEIRFVELTSFDKLVRGNFNVFEPKKREFIHYTPKVLIIPGIAFDKERNRLGHGKGFYDRFLKGKQTYKIAIAFDFQIVDKIPLKPHDIGMDLIITEKRIL